MTRGDTIKTYMVKKGIEPKELAPLLDISLGYMYKILSNKSIPNQDIMRKLAEILEFDVAEIVPDENEMVDRIALDTPELLNKIPKSELRDAIEKPDNDIWVVFTDLIKLQDIDKMLKGVTDPTLTSLLKMVKIGLDKQNNS